MRFLLATFVIGTAMSSHAVLAQGASLVAPAGYFQAEGNSNNGFPWNLGVGSMRYQQLYDSLHFTVQGVHAPIVIRRLRFRANETTGSWVGGSWPNVQIDLSTAAVDHLAFSTTFANNHGPDQTTVLGPGPVVVPAGTGNGAGVPGPWYIDIALDRPFVYDPSTGRDLVLDIRLDGTGWTGASTQADAVNSTGVPAPQCSRLWSTISPNEAVANGSQANYGLVTDFVFDGVHPLTTTYADDNGNGNGGGVYFDLLVRPTEGISIDAIGINCKEPVGTAATLDVYVRSGTYSGHETSPNGWLHVVASAPFVADGRGVETKVCLSKPVELCSGTWGICVISTGTAAGGQAYTTSAGTYDDSVVRLTAGSATNAALAPGVVNSPRTFNGTLYYGHGARDLRTTFASNNNNTCCPGGGVFFDAVVQHAAGVRVTSFEINSSLLAGTNDVLNVWVRRGTSLGSELSPAGWRQVAVAVPFTAAGVDRPTSVVLTRPIFLEQGLTGIAMNCGAGSFHYTNATAANTAYGDGIVDITTQTAASTCLAPGMVFGPRVWNGVLHYQVLDPEVLQFQFDDLSGVLVGNSARNTVAPATGTVSNTLWHGDPGRPHFRGNEPGFGMLANTGGATGRNLVNTGWPMNTTGDMTIMWWQRRVGTPPTATYIWGGPGTAGVRCFTGGVALAGIAYRGSTIGDIYSVGSVQGATNIWQHVALVIDDGAGQARWYLDGQLDVVRTFPPRTHAAVNSDFHIGYHTSTSTSYVAYYDVDDFRFYGKALTALEIRCGTQTENPAAGNYGVSCGSGTAGTYGGLPTVMGGNPGFGLILTGAPAAQLYANVAGIAPAAFGSYPLPFIGPGCALQVDWTDAVFGVTSPTGIAQRPLGLPANPLFAGSHIYAQWLVGPFPGGTVTLVTDVNLH